MKSNKKKLMILVFISIIILSAAFAIGCKKQAEELKQPDGFYVDGSAYLHWNEVKNADSYFVSIDGEEYSTETNSIDLFDKCLEDKEYSIKVCAIRKGFPVSEAGYYDYNISYTAALGYKEDYSGKGLIITVMDQSKLPPHVVIPSEINGKPVVSVIGNAFKNCNLVTTIYMPDSITKIGSDCFYGCSNLERIRLSQNIETIPGMCFFACKKLKQVSIPTGVKMINPRAFGLCESMETILLPNSLTSLNLNIFSGCRKLKRLDISQVISNIEGYGVDFEVVVNEKNPNYYSLNNCILDKRSNEVVAAGKLSVIPEVAVSIGKQAFADSELKAAVIPRNIKTIKERAFDASSVEEIIIEDGVEEICKKAFTSCLYLKKITIPASVTKIEDGSIISGYNALEEIVVAPENKTYYAVDGYILTKANNIIVAGTLKKPIPVIAKGIAEYAFSGNTQENIFMPSTVKNISNYAFNLCLKVKTAIFFSEKIGSLVFGKTEPLSCFNMTSIRISKDVKYIEKDAFYICHNVNSITLPDDVVLGGNLIYSPVAYTVYYPQSVDFSAMPYGSFGCVQSAIGYDGDFPYVKSIKPVYITTEYGGREITQLEYSSDFLAPTREGYTFEGWSENEDCSTLDYPVYIREAFRYEMFTEKHNYLESRLTHNPFAEKQNLKPNEYYNPEVKILYAVWRKN